MDEDHLYKAFVAVIIALVTIILIASFLAYNGRYAEALGIGGVLSGLSTLLGILARGKSPTGNTQADTNLATMIDKIPPTTTGTGPATPVESKDETNVAN